MDYKKIYDELISRATDRDRPVKSENHHILPKSLGGLDVDSNLVYLSPREHYIAHLLLTKIYPSEPKMAFALWFMSQKNSSTTLERKYKVTSRQYDYSRTLFYDAREGYKHSDETRSKMTGPRGPSEVKSIVQKKIISRELQEGKIRSARLKSDLPFWTDGFREIRSKDSPDNRWIRGRITKGKKWWNNGQDSKMSILSPGAEWFEGRIYRRKK